MTQEKADRATDRTVHAEMTNGSEVVRYDRAGKWWLEGPEGRVPLTLREAVGHAIDGPNVRRIHLNRPGGRRFDALVTRDPS